MAGYGAINGDPASENRPNQGSEDESGPLLGKKDSPRSLAQLRDYLKEDIDRRWADLLLLLSYIITGLLDSSAVFIWGSFVSMQTGNTVYLGLGLVEPTKGTRWIRSLTSIAFFCFGSFCFSRFHRHFSPKRRWVLLASFAAQLLLVVVAAVVVMVDSKQGNDLRWEVIVPLALVAFQSSGQAVTSRALQYNSLTSVVLTSIYCDLFSDPLIMAGLSQNAERNRRAAAPLLLLFGAILGGLWAHSPVGLAGALWTAAALKITIILAFFLWRAQPPTQSR
ncbi:uncharacterized protein Z520_11907 [Fonsecaea multimorphosa CBS 102226]|uniref:DUF1275 domain protein n=1 Tax=Fonsecaea multimorphosa CBS 102226 TaxID=1442371 RepID=A0A0D2JGX9_9EURO|nr:uncharacterized protein Z520_11907 [Fonsecaea multimorphosa CBS 102226]KIX92432.1 hypothetical protein Z520_11907 [Fonsecaea multimorphosa CBS 102226]OAL17801.1 hypothetical protein AYO22_11329 [Fonsecaea multimorphosa]